MVLLAAYITVTYVVAGLVIGYWYKWQMDKGINIQMDEVQVLLLMLIAAPVIMPMLIGVMLRGIVHKVR